MKGDDSMDTLFKLTPLRVEAVQLARQMEACNRMSRHYGLSLDYSQIQELEEGRYRALADYGRIEFGEGILQDLVQMFCDSPYLTQENYAAVLAELQDIFYYFKSESMDSLTDEELLEMMRTLFNGKAQGSTAYLSGTSMETLCRYFRGGWIEEGPTDREGEDNDAEG